MRTSRRDENGTCIRNLCYLEQFPAVALASFFIFIAYLYLIIVLQLIPLVSEEYGSQEPNNVNVHPLFMAGGLFLFSGNGMLVYRCYCISLETAEWLHILLNVVAIPCIFVGLIVIQGYHEDAITPYDHQNFSSHAWLGILTILLFVIQLLLSVYIYYIYGRSQQHCEKVRRLWTRYSAYHTFLGIAIFFLTIQLCISGSVIQQSYLYPPMGFPTLKVTSTDEDYVHRDFWYFVAKMKFFVVLVIIPCVLMLYSFLRN